MTPSEKGPVTDPDDRVVERYVWSHGIGAKSTPTIVLPAILENLGAASRGCGIPIPRLVTSLRRLYPVYASPERITKALRRQERREAGQPLRWGDAWKATPTMRRASRGVVAPGYIASVAVILTGFALDIVGHTNPFPYAPFAVIGPIVVALGIGLGMIQGGLGAHPYFILIATISIAIALIAVGYYNVGGAQAWGL